MKKNGGYFYNQALVDVHSLISKKTESITDELGELMKETLDG